MKNQNIKYGIFILFVLIYKFVNAQQQPQYTQHMYNTTAINPAYAGTNDGLEASLLHRSQWVGVNGAPVTQSLAIDGKVSNKASLGLGAYNEKIGPSNEVSINGIFAYEVVLGQSINLSLGLNLGVDFYNVDWSKGMYYDNQDPIFNENINEIRPIMGAGSFLYGEKWYLGVSSPNLLGLNSFNQKNDNEKIIERVNHYYLMGGYVFDLSDQLKLKPAVLAKIIEGAPISLDASANFLIQDKLTLGAAYRFDDAVSGIIGLQLGQRIFVGYSYDYTLSDLNDYNNGSHEVILKYSGGKKRKAKRDIRFF